MRPIIKFCVSNLANGAQAAREILEKDPDLDIVEYACLRHCGICAQTFYALVNGKVVEGKDPKELVENIYQYIEENLVF